MCMCSACMHACMCSACMHVLCMHPAHSLEGYSALLLPYIGVRETRTGYVLLGLVDLGSRSLGIFLVVFVVVVSRGCIICQRGCIICHRGCIINHRGCIICHRGCIIVHRGCIISGRWRIDSCSCLAGLPIVSCLGLHPNGFAT